MEVLIKEQLGCMKKMLSIVQQQDGKEPDYKNYNDDDDDSNNSSNNSSLQFEESFNVTNNYNIGMNSEENEEHDRIIKEKAFL